MHAGGAFADQNPQDLMWIRGAFVTSDVEHEYVIVHGDTPSQKIENKGIRININTGAVYGGLLTAVVLSGRERTFLQV